MMISQPITDTSEAWRAVASAAWRALITKLVPLVIVPTLNIPRAAAPVAPIDCLQIWIKELVVTAVVATVTVPPTRVTEPIEFAPAAEVVPTLERTILLPAAVRTKLPFVAVMFPKVAVKEVVAAIEPGAMNVLGTEKVKEFKPPVVVIWLAVPAIVTSPVAEGTTGFVPASGVKESIATPPPVKPIVIVFVPGVRVTPVPAARVKSPPTAGKIPLIERIPDVVPPPSGT